MDSKDSNQEVAELDSNQGKGAELDPNHTHFILIDDGRRVENVINNGTISQEFKIPFGGEIEFRGNLEKELREGKSEKFYRDRHNVTSSAKNSYSRRSQVNLIELKKDEIPMVLIVVEGGPNTLKTVKEAVEKNVPILVLAVSLFIFYTNLVEQKVSWPIISGGNHIELNQNGS